MKLGSNGSRLVVLLATLAMLGFAFAAPTASSTEAARQGSLSVSPGEFYGGQGLRFTGNIGRAGKTRIWLEYHMGRPGDRWTRIEDSNRTTRSNGSFSFVFPARGMNNISIRVAARGRTTRPVRFNADEQQVRLSVSPSLPGSEDYLDYQVRGGEPITFTVDSTPEGEPVLAGRAVTLQRRTGHQGWSTRWATVATGSLDREGVTRFEVDAPAAGTAATYRARLGEWTKGGSRIGWFPSFPVVVRGLAPSSRPVAAPVAPMRTTSTLSARRVSSEAFSRYGWSPALFDFGFEYGESLDDRPFRGTKRRGRWLEYSDGSGRVAKHNGGMMLESKYGRVTPGDAGPGDFGVTAMTLTGNAQTYGRWELRIRPWTAERGAEDYRIRAEVVPQKYGQYDCGARSIVLADITPHKDEVRFGAYSPKRNRSWTGAKQGVRIYQSPNAYAVEVGRGHITWFVNGNPVGTVKSRAAVPGVPLTLRISMVGDGAEEMNHTYAVMDWIRGYKLDRGRQVRSGKALKGGKHTLGC